MTYGAIALRVCPFAGGVISHRLLVPQAEREEARRQVTAPEAIVEEVEAQVVGGVLGLGRCGRKSGRHDDSPKSFVSDNTKGSANSEELVLSDTKYRGCPGHRVPFFG